MKAFLSILVIISCGVLHAMVDDGIHSTQDYVNLAQSEKIYESACIVVDRVTGVNQSGVLVHKNIVATAAHGIVHILQKKKISINDEVQSIPVSGVFVTFTQPYRLTVEVTHVVIVPQYVSKVMGKEAKYDIAFLKLQSSVEHIEVPQFYDIAEMDTTMPAYAVTHGSLGLPEQSPVVARAFALLEFDHIYTHGFDEETLGVDKPIMLSSIFLNSQPSSQLLEDEEFKVRNTTALKRWKKHHQPPTGLALYGSSGAPVFAYVKVGSVEQLALVGIITSFAPLSTSQLTKKQQRDPNFLLRNSDQVRGRFQSIFALFYVEDTSKNNAKLISLKRSSFMKRLFENKDVG